MTKLVVATSNRGKLAEIKALLAGVDAEVVSAADVLGRMPVVEETETTYRGNALKKALAIAEATSMLTLADDSGLEVDALGGRPGLFSARFAGEHATDQQNRAALLAELAGVDDAARTARFRCVLALVARGEAPIIVEGTCEGRITRAARGASGFGYDPLFWVSSEDATMAELTEERKNQLSHRGRAAAALRPLLDELLSRT